MLPEPSAALVQTLPQLRPPLRVQSKPCLYSSRFSSVRTPVNPGRHLCCPLTSLCKEGEKHNGGGGPGRRATPPPRKVCSHVTVSEVPLGRVCSIKSPKTRDGHLRVTDSEMKTEKVGTTRDRRWRGCGAGAGSALSLSTPSLPAPAVGDTVERWAGTTDPIREIILITIIIIIIIIIKSQGKIAAAFYVFVGVVGFFQNKTQHSLPISTSDPLVSQA